MKINDILDSGEKTFSFEFFPPKSYSSILELGINVGQLMKLSPSFISVTYGAGGSTQDASFSLIDYINNKIALGISLYGVGELQANTYSSGD